MGARATGSAAPSPNRSCAPSLTAGSNCRSSTPCGPASTTVAAISRPEAAAVDGRVVDTTAPFEPFGPTPVRGTTFHLGSSEAFGRPGAYVRIDVELRGGGPKDSSTKLKAADGAIAFEYFDGRTWKGLAVSDATNVFRKPLESASADDRRPRNGALTFLAPADWKPATVGSVTSHFLRVRLDDDDVFGKGPSSDEITVQADTASKAETETKTETGTETETETETEAETETETETASEIPSKTRSTSTSTEHEHDHEHEFEFEFEYASNADSIPLCRLGLADRHVSAHLLRAAHRLHAHRSLRGGERRRPDRCHSGCPVPQADVRPIQGNRRRAARRLHGLRPSAAPGAREPFRRCPHGSGHRH